MSQLLQFSVCGIKNINKEITINLAELSTKSVKKPNKVTAIFGFNGAGKTALMTGIYIYKNVIINKYYLNQLSTQKRLKKLCNLETKKIKVSLTFKASDNKIFKHTIEIENELISKEIIEELNKRTLNEKGTTIVKAEKGKVIESTFKDNVVNDRFNYIDCSTNSIAFVYLTKIINEKLNDFVADKAFAAFAKVFNFAFNLEVQLQNSDLHRNSYLDLNSLDETYELLKKELLENESVASDEAVFEVSDKNFLPFKKRIVKLERFIKIFKPDLIRIDIKDKINGDNHNVNLIFVYGDEWMVDFEYESSGIKQLVSIFDNLLSLVNGKIVFIDEMDTNINSIYLEKLIEYFMNYGNGQLVFTTHNIDAMNILKKQSRSIVVVGDNSTAEVWVKKGHSNPINQYKEGYFLNSPACIEDFDFVKVFEAE